MKISGLFLRDIYRKIRPVIEVEDRNEAELRDELNEYVITDQIANGIIRLLEGSYFDRSPRGVALWISGFFGTGKSLFLKLFALAVAHARIGETSVIDYLVGGTDNIDLHRTLRTLAKRRPAKVIALHMRSDAHERESIVSILWRRLHQEFGYSRIPWIAEIERSLERRGLLEAFTIDVEKQHGRSWAEIRLEPIFQNAALTKGLIAVDAGTFPDQASAEQAIKDARDQENDLLTVARFIDRCLELLSEHPAYDRLFFALDEMGQFAANDPDLLLELTVLVEKFLSEGKGKLWLAATAQERLDQVVDNFAQRRDDVNKIHDRFVKELRIELTSENAELIVLDRLLKKSTQRTEELRAVLEPDRAWIEHETVLPDANLELRPSRLDDVLASYPFVPSQFNLITRFMQGLAHDVGGTADRTAKGARALIGVTQDIVRELADKEAGAMASLDGLYVAMEGNIPSEDVEVVHALDNEHRRPALSSEVLRANYILDQIGERHVLSTQANLARAVLAEIGSPIGEVQARTEAALQYLTAHAYVRETGGSGKTTYRFLRAYQRKIEDDVRNFVVDGPKLAIRSQALFKEVLESLGVIGTKITYRSTRSFQLVAAVDAQSVQAEGRLKISVWSPSRADFANAQAESVKNHAVIWVSGNWPAFEDEIRSVVATSAVLAARREKATTQLEDEQIRRAHSDLEFREARLREQAERALLGGGIYVYGAPLKVTKDVANSIVEAIVDADYRGLADAPFPVVEADLIGVFASLPPKDGAAVKLGLVDGAAFSDRSNVVADFLSVLDELHFRGGPRARCLSSEWATHRADTQRCKQCSRRVCCGGWAGFKSFLPLAFTFHGMLPVSDGCHALVSFVRLHLSASELSTIRSLGQHRLYCKSLIAPVRLSCPVLHLLRVHL